MVIFARDLEEIARYRLALREILADPRVPQSTKLLSIQETWTQLLRWFMKDEREIPFPIHINSWSTVGGFLNQMKQESRQSRSESHAIIKVALPSVDCSDQGYVEFVQMIVPVMTRKQLSSDGLRT